MDSTKIFLLIIGNALNITFSLIFFYLIRILFSIEIVGSYGVLLSFIFTFSFINDLGFNIPYLKFYADAKDSKEKAICNGAFLTIRGIQFVTYSIVILSLIPIIPVYEGELLVVYIFFVAMGFLRLTFFEPIFMSKKEAFKRSIIAIFTNFLKNVLLIISIFFFERTIWLLVYIILIPHMINFFLSLYSIKDRKFNRPNLAYLKKFFTYSFPLVLTSIFLIIVNNIDVLFLNEWSDIDNVANYFTAKQLFSYFLIITTSISNILITTFSNNISEGKLKRNIKIANYIHKILNLLVVPLIFVTILYANDLFVFIFGANYGLTGQILFIFIFILFPMSLDIANTVQLQALGKLKFYALFSIIENITSMILMIFFISPAFLNLDVFGGALSYLISKILIQLIYRPIIYKKFNLGFYWGSLRNLLIMTGIFLIQWWINNIFTFPIFFIPIFTVFDIIVYFLINYLLKGFSKQDIRFVIKTLNIKRVFKSITSEYKVKS
jgi:O-antigen/teichoic acid export membrane protein